MVTIDRSSSKPIYQQIADGIRKQIREGDLPVDTRLPPIRGLARDLGVTRLTIESAYDELRSEGWIMSVVGRGTFVARSAPPDALIDSVGPRSSPDGVIDDMRRIEATNTVRSFAYASPDPALLPAEEFYGALARCRGRITELMNYGDPQGAPRLRLELARVLKDRGIEETPDRIVVAAGVTQSMALVIRALTEPGDVVAVEQPTHFGTLGNLTMHHVRSVGVLRDQAGPRPDSLEQVIRQYRPRFFYTIPAFHNPTGYAMTDDRRRALLDLAAHHGLMLVEDDISGLLSYDGPPQPALKAMDDHGVVIYVTGFSKNLMPGLRVGYIVAPTPTHEAIVRLKRLTSVSDAPLLHAALAEFLADGGFKRHLKRIVPAYTARRDHMLRSLTRLMPAGVEWTEPQGGYVIWLKLPPGLSSTEICRDALRMGFAFTPGESFWSHQQEAPHVRVAFGAHAERHLTEGIEVLAQVIHEHMEAGPPPDLPRLPF